MENLSMALDLLSPHCWLAKIDLKNAFYSLAMRKRDRAFLRFTWEEEIYEFLRMPNGFSQAPRVFTKVLKPVVAHLRSQGIMLVLYLDDILIISATLDEARSHLSQVKILLTHLGFTLNLEKSSQEPSQTIEFLGFILDTSSMSISLPGEKKASISALCQELLNQGTCSVRDLAKILGQLQAADPAIKIARLHYRKLQDQKIAVLRKERNYEAVTPLSPQARAELSWWIEHLPKMEGIPIHLAESQPIEIFTDASLEGYGAFCEGEGIQAPWIGDKKGLHINILEMHAALIALEHFTRNIPESSILMKIDNKTALSYINKMGGTRSQVLTDLALQFWELVLNRKLILRAEYIKSEDNVAADLLSRRRIRKSEWSLHPQVFRAITQKWGLPTVDLFASHHNAKVQTYISWKFQDQAWATDALKTPWPSTHLAYAFPEFNLIGKTLKKLESSKVDRLIMICPAWKTAFWYPLLLSKLVEIPMSLPDWADLITDQWGEPHPLQEQATLNLRAWMVSPNELEQKAFLSELPNTLDLDGEQDPGKLTKLTGDPGLSGVIQGKSIPLKHLSLK